MNTNLIASVLVLLSTNWIKTDIPAPAGKQVCVGVIESNTIARIVFEYKTNDVSLRKDYGIAAGFATNDSLATIIFTGNVVTNFHDLIYTEPFRYFKYLTNSSILPNYTIP